MMANRQKDHQQHGNGQGDGENRNWFQRKKDDLIGTKEERAKEKAEKKKRKEEEDRAYVVGVGISNMIDTPLTP
jgi:hypothetical protein